MLQTDSDMLTAEPAARKSQLATVDFCATGRSIAITVISSCIGWLKFGMIQTDLDDPDAAL